MSRLRLCLRCQVALMPRHASGAGHGCHVVGVAALIPGPRVLTVTLTLILTLVPEFDPFGHVSGLRPLYC